MLRGVGLFINMYLKLFFGCIKTYEAFSLRCEIYNVIFLDDFCYITISTQSQDPDKLVTGFIITTYSLFCSYPKSVI